MMGKRRKALAILCILLSVSVSRLVDNLVLGNRSGTQSKVDRGASWHIVC